MKTSFLGQAYQARSPIMASQTAVNVYLELTAPETPGSGTGGFYGTPGLQSVYQGPIAPVRGKWVGGIKNSFLFAVIGNSLYRFDAAYNATNLGAIPGTGPVSMIDNGTQLGVFHSQGAHWVALNGTAVAPIAGAPTGGIASYTDNYIVFSENIDGQFGITALGDLSSINPLDVATAEGWPDDCIAVVCDHRLAWLIGTETIEIWSDTGANTFPFERVPGGSIEVGCAAPYSVAKLDNSVFLVGRDRKGQGVVYRVNYSSLPQRISTHAIEYAIRGANISDAIGMVYQEEGHLFYMLTFPSLDQTWVYDVATGPNGAWHRRAYQNKDGTLSRHRANSYAYFNGDHLVGDWRNGKIYRMSLDLTTDDGTPIYRERAWEIDSDETENQRIRIDELKVVALAGDGDPSALSSPLPPLLLEDSGPILLEDGNPLLMEGSLPQAGAPLIWLQISRDGGRNFGYERFQKLGALGQRKAQARWRRLGSGRNTVLRLATTMTSRVSWTGAFMRGEVLDV